MKSASPLTNILKKGLFGDHENKNNLTKIKEEKNLLIFQIVQYKSSKLKTQDVKIEDLSMSDDELKVISNRETRILWNGPKNWLLVSKKNDLKENIKKTFNEKDFAVTDLSHSRTIIQIEGENSKEILKKGCPYNFNELKKNMSINSVFNGITITIDMLEESPKKIRIFTLRSFGESLFHSISDASLEYGFEIIE